MLPTFAMTRLVLTRIMKVCMNAFDEMLPWESNLPPYQKSSYEVTLITSTHVLAHLRARFASIICLLPSVFLKLASAISRVC